jgi:phosphoribosyl-ATP pyrophosphohydrolase
MTLPNNGVKFVRTTGVGVAAGEFRLEVREEFSNVTNIAFAKYLSLKDIVDLEGQLSYLRMQAEAGDVEEPKKTLEQEIADHPNLDDGSRFRAACKILGINYDEECELIAQLKKESAPSFTGTPTGPVPMASVVTSFRADGKGGMITLSGPDTEWTTVDEIGNFVDLIADNKRRHPEIVARRALEEMVELCLAAGASSATILNGVADAMYNQCLKIKERTVFPSQFRTTFDRKDVTEELADVRLVLLDLMHVSSVTEKSVGAQMRTKLQKLKSNPVQNFVTDGHTFYLKKSHVVDAPST